MTSIVDAIFNELASVCRQAVPGSSLAKLLPSHRMTIAGAIACLLEEGGVATRKDAGVSDTGGVAYSAPSSASMGEPPEGLSDKLSGAESTGDLAAPTASPANTSAISVIAEGGYKVYEINGEKFFPESAVHMLIDEAKKLGIMKRESVAPELYDALYYAAEEAIPYIDRHPYGKPVSANIRRKLQAIVAVRINQIEGGQP